MGKHACLWRILILKKKDVEEGKVASPTAIVSGLKMVWLQATKT